MSILGEDLPEGGNPGIVGLIDVHKSGWFLNDSDELFSGFHVSPEDRVLDVGCGDGAITFFCATRGASITVTDVDEDAVREVERKIQADGRAASFTGIVCDSDPLLVADASANRVICREVLEHVADPLRVVQELYRVGEPGALFLISVPGELGETIQKSIAPAEYFQHPNHIRIFSREQFSSLIEEAGLDILSYSAQGFFSFFWMCLQWAVDARKYAGKTRPDGAIFNTIKPPYDDVLRQWADVWFKLVSTPEGESLKHELDNIIPKNQVIVARKPG